MMMTPGAYEPFSYIHEGNLEHLRHLLLIRRAEPWVVAVVINHLPRDLGCVLLARLPDEVREEALLNPCESRRVEAEDVVALDFAVRTNLDILSEAAGRMVPLEAA